MRFFFRLVFRHSPELTDNPETHVSQARENHAFHLVFAEVLESKRRMPAWISVVLLGIIEGITEFIPISSTGHLLIAEHWVPPQTELFNIVIQCGAVLA